MASLAALALRLKPPAAARHLPRLILMTDADRLPDPLAAAARLPRGAAVILRHYGDPGRAALARALVRLGRAKGMRVLVAGDARLARAVGAAGLHVPEAALAGPWRRWRRPGWVVTAAAHSPRAMRRAAALGADGVLLSPVFATASHPGVRPLGPLRFARWVRQSPVPVYALGGITPLTARRLLAMPLAGFAAIAALA